MQNSASSRQQRQERLGSIPEIPQSAQRRLKSQAPPPPKLTSMNASTSSFVVKRPTTSASSLSLAASSTVSPSLDAATPLTSHMAPSCAGLPSLGAGAVPKKRPAPKRPQSDDGSDAPSESSGHRSVTVTLKRQQNSPLGFSIRGGREHGTGVYVSQIDPNSEAEAAGIKAGDQILKVNGFPVDQFVHAEVCMMLKQNNVVTLKLSGTGMLPVKDRGDVVLKPVANVDTSPKSSIPLPPAEPDFAKNPPVVPPAPIPPAPPAPPNTMRPIPPPMPTHMFVSELHSVAQQLRKLQITKDIALENPLLKQVAINQQQHDKLMSEFKEAHRKMFGQGDRFPDDFSDTDRTIERQKTERTEVLCMKNGESGTASNLRSAASTSSILSLKTDSGRGSASPFGSASSSPASSIVDSVTESSRSDQSAEEKAKSSSPFGVQLKSLRRESSNIELCTPSKIEAKTPLRREQSSLELSSLRQCVLPQKIQESNLSAVAEEPVPIPKKAMTPTAVAKNNEPLRNTQSVPLVQASPFGTFRRESAMHLEKQLIVQDKNIRRESSSYIIPKKEFEKAEFKRDFGSNTLDIHGFETIPENSFVNNRTGRTEVIFIRNSRENGRDIETSSVISSDEGSTYSGSSGCGELVGRLRRQFEDPGSDSDSSGSAGSKGPGLFSKRTLGPVTSGAGGKITVSIGVAALPKNAC